LFWPVRPVLELTLAFGAAESTRTEGTVDTSVQRRMRLQ